MAADTSVKYFDSEMAGASVLSGTAGALVGILRECLVTGRGLASATINVAGGVATVTLPAGHPFVPNTVALIAGATPGALNGEKRVISNAAGSFTFDATGVADGAASGSITVKLAPAGWSEAFTATNKGAFKSASPSASGCYARIDDTGAKVARLRAYVSMTDVDTGTGPTPTDAQVSGGLYVPKSNDASTVARKWVLAATDRCCVLMVAYHGSFSYDYTPIAFGDFPSLMSGDAYPFLLAADASDTSSVSYVASSACLTKNEYQAGVYIVRSYVGSGGAVPGVLRKPGLLADSGSLYLPVGPNPMNNTLEVCPTLLFEGAGNSANRRGVAPGVYGIPHFVGTGFDSKDTLSAVDGLAGHKLMFFRYNSNSTPNGYRYAVDVSGPWS